MKPSLNNIAIQVAQTLAEDLGNGDVTGELIPVNETCVADLNSFEPMIVCGQDWVDAAFRQLDPKICIEWHCQEKAYLSTSFHLATIRGHARAILTAERTALNFLQLLSGTATQTYHYTQLIKHTATKLLDTRKTIPGLRLSQKYAVTCGGGNNHRMGLYDAFLIKENHIIACGSISNAIEKAQAIQPNLLLEVEVENLSELEEALSCGVKRILLDNFSLEQIKAAVIYTDGRAQLEVSGGVNLNNIVKIAEAGVDFISVGILTKNVKAIDLSLRIQKIEKP